MATSKELRANITKNREALKSAIEGAASKWEEAKAGDGDQRSPREVAEHAFGADQRNASTAAAILGGNPPPAAEASFATAQDAAEAVAKLGPEFDRRYSWAEDRDLSKGREGNTLEGVMQSAANHLAEHAAELSS